MVLIFCHFIYWHLKKSILCLFVFFDIFLTEDRMYVFLTQDMKLVSPMNSFAPSKEHQLEATQAEMGDPSCEEIMKFTSHDLLVK